MKFIHAKRSILLDKLVCEYHLLIKFPKNGLQQLCAQSFFSNKILRYAVCPMVYNLITSVSVFDPIVCAWNSGVIFAFELRQK